MKELLPAQTIKAPLVGISIEASAGLKGLQPNPPKDILPTPIANSAPRMIIQIVRLDGKLNASNTPVMIAEPSQIVVVGFFSQYFPIAHSKLSLIHI